MTQRIRIRLGLILALLVGTSSVSFAQLKKAKNYNEQEQYADAIKYYAKVLKKDAANVEATESIAFAYRKLKDYDKAEVFYARATQLNPSESANFLYYGQTLKNNNKLREAKTQFEKFVAQNPNSFVGKLLVQSCGDIGEWEMEEKAFEVSHMENINSTSADFCPVVFQNGIVFVSERGIDLVNENHYGMSNKPYLSIFFAREDKDFGKAKQFSTQLNTIYHDGPVSLSSDQKTIYFTRADKKEEGKQFTNLLKVYSATLDGKKWKEVTPFKHNSSSHSIAHPWISEDGERIFFSSDMEGGQGGMDIYVCTREGDYWGKPINLGESVNTSGNEVFPYFRKGTLYFSSDGLSGYGGLDVFEVKETNLWQGPENLKAPLNSPKDDFGIFYKDDENGYFSSNRDGGLGSDDIYEFNWHSVVPQTAMSGLLEFDKLGASGTTINLLDENDNVLRSTETDENGRFKFDKLDLDESYILGVEAKDDSFLEKVKLFLTNKNGQKVLLANRVGKGKFKFKALPHTYYDELELLKEEDESLFTVKVFGQIYEKLPGDYSGGMDVWVVDDEGNIIGKAKSDKDGKFIFDKLSPNDEYLFRLSEDDESLKIIIVDEEGDVLEAAKRLIDGKYRYIRLGSENNVITLKNETDEVIKIGENDNFIISKVLYDYRSSKISKSAAKELDKLVVILKKNEAVGVELSSHTDSKGSDAYNMQLSQKRANKAVAYVVSKGVKKRRIIAKGYGETQPVAPNTLPNGKDNPAGRAKNRRTEFKVINLK